METTTETKAIPAPILNFVMRLNMIQQMQVWFYTGDEKFKAKCPECISTAGTEIERTFSVLREPDPAKNPNGLLFVTCEECQCVFEVPNHQEALPPPQTESKETNVTN